MTQHSSSMSPIKVKFAKGSTDDFYNTLRRRVSAYFDDNKISRHGDYRMFIKTAFMLSLYFIPYFASLLLAESAWAYWGLWMLMGLGLSGVGLSVMHDAGHGAYSADSRINTLLAYSLNFAGGGCAAFWNIQHNMLHHTYTNIHGLDEDISRTKLLRFSPHAEKRPMHKYQHYYGWFLYCLMTISWITAKEFKQLKEFNERGLVKDKKTYNLLLLELVLTKVLYYGYALILPLLFAPVAWWVVVISFLSMHFVAGLILSLIFQPAHVITTSEYPMPDEHGTVENNWAVHQITTTANFSGNSTYFSWFVGGLNYQIEHHLFPRVCHIHYKDISKIVRETSAEFNLPYHSQPTWFAAIYNHGKLLREFARMA
jgi:linoleoyl-CoA desaturase